MKKICRLLGLWILFVSVIACDKIDGVSSTRLADEEQNWNTYEDARANLLSLYGLMRSATVADNGHWLMGDLRRGDFTITNRSDLKAIVNEQLNASYPMMERLTNWRRFYAVINASNLFIERSSQILEEDRRYTEINNNVDVAQARIMRAFAYFYMVRIWGDVPFYTSSHDGQFPMTGRVDQNKILDFATREILEAVQDIPFRYGGTDPILPGSYYGAGWSTWNGQLFTRLSAYSILAHIAAWQGNYIDAALYSKYVLDNVPEQAYGVDGSYGVTYLDMNALTENENTYSPFAYKRATVLIGFPFESGNGLATANGHIEQLILAEPFIPKSRPEMYVNKDTINSAFTDPYDLRFSVDSATNLYRTNYFYNYESELPIFNKIKVITPDKTSGNFMMYASSMVFTRLEEITLLRAEALAVLGDREGAFENLNKATEKRGIKFTTSDTPDIIDAIFQERRRELMAEGWRWYDIVRYNRIKKSADVFISKDGQNMTFKEFEEAGGVHWPVSQDVMTSNSAVNQNPYWQ